MTMSLSYPQQTSLFEEKLFEHYHIARARFCIKSEWTRNAAKILIADIQEGDEDFRECFIPQKQLVGGYKKRNGAKYKSIEEEAKLMLSDNLLVEEPDKSGFTVYAFFDGKVRYDKINKGIWCRLNPHLAKFYLGLAFNFTVLQRDTYLSLSTPFYKDLYEWILGCQNAKKDNSFFISAEDFCAQFGCEHYLYRRKNLVNRVMTAYSEICKAVNCKCSDLVFYIAPKYAETKQNAKQQGKLLGFNIEIERPKNFARRSDIPVHKRTKMAG